MSTQVLYRLLKEKDWRVKTSLTGDKTFLKVYGRVVKLKRENQNLTF